MGDEPVPGVVIVHGSGPNDRDGTFGPNKPYEELAWGLASRGVAVLRYDKRTNACDVDLSDVTVDDVATDDALTAVERLRDHDRVAGDSLFLAGHSLGGVLAPRIATRDSSLAGAVMLAPGPVRPMAETVLDQQRHLLEQQDLTDEERQSRRKRGFRLCFPRSYQFQDSIALLEAVLCREREPTGMVRTRDVATGSIVALIALASAVYRRLDHA